ncbi:MAG TPA: hypothetical protein VFY13_03675 [Luteolibacter sp.]|nr:hypothetical protein [Luteolibacter sp.]
MKHSGIRFLEILYLRGPNRWTYRPVLEARVDIGEFEDHPSNTLPGFVERLCAWLPSLHEHRCSYGEPGGFVRRLHEGTWIGHILEHVTLELQNLAGAPGGFGRARETDIRGVYHVVVQAWYEEVTLACLHAARDLLLAAIDDVPHDVTATHERLRAVAKQHLLGSDTACIVEAALAKDRLIPAIRLPAHNLVQLGYGVQQRRVWATRSDQTGAIAQGIARDPAVRATLLGACGLPVAAAGHPPTPADCACRHHLLVVGGRMVAASRVTTGSDSGRTLEDVTDQVHPTIAEASCLAVRAIRLDLAGVQWRVEDISRPLDQQDAQITDVHDAPELGMHPQPAAGELHPAGKAILDHLFPNGQSGRIPVIGITGSRETTAVARWVAEFLRLSGKFTGLACADGLFYDQRQVETGDCGNWTCGTKVLMNRSVEAAVLENKAQVILGQGLAYDRCQVGVVTGIVPEDHYGEHQVSKPEQVFQVMRTQIDVVLPSGCAVLPAADPMAVEMAALCDGEVIYYAADAESPVIRQHCAGGGKAVYIRAQRVVLASVGQEVELLALSEIPSLHGSDACPQRCNTVLAAVAAAWAAGIATHVIRTGAETYLAPPSGQDSPAPTTLNA